MGDKFVVIGGGADIAQQYLKAGLVDEIQIHLVSKLLGAGTRLFDNLDNRPTELENIRTIVGNGVTHLRFRVINTSKSP